MNTSTRILAVVLALLILAGGIALSSFAAPIYDTDDGSAAPLAPPATPGPIPVETPAPETPAAPVEETAEPAPETPETTAPPDEVPVEEPEPEPAPEPEPEATPEPLLDPEYFDDAAFLGDSISGVLEYYGLNHEGLGNPTFLVTVDYSVQAAVDHSMFVQYHGKACTPESALEAAGISKVYIMLGAMGDLANFGIDKTMENWAKLVENIRGKNPDIRIFIQSCTPLAADTPKLTNKMIDEYNARLKDFAAENDCTYVEIGEHFKDARGLLPYEHCRDGFAHLRIDSANTWVELLKDPANYSVSPRA
ncbi:MAG: SGNH/GDSL hydrolase family protein [Clostridia bacterium]